MDQLLYLLTAIIIFWSNYQLAIFEKIIWINRNYWLHIKTIISNQFSISLAVSSETIDIASIILMKCALSLITKSLLISSWRMIPCYRSILVSHYYVIRLSITIWMERYLRNCWSIHFYWFIRCLLDRIAGIKLLLLPWA